MVRLNLDGTVARIRFDRRATSVFAAGRPHVRADGKKVLLEIRSGRMDISADLGGAAGKRAWRPGAREATERRRNVCPRTKFRSSRSPRSRAPWGPTTNSAPTSPLSTKRPERPMSSIFASCPAAAPSTPPGRLAAIRARLAVMLHGVDEVRPALERFWTRSTSSSGRD